MRRRRIFKYSKLYYFLSYIVELIILLLVNFILEKSFIYCTKVHSYFEKGNKYNISLHINLNVLRKLMILCWATISAVLGRMRPTGHGLDSPDVKISLEKLSACNYATKRRLWIRLAYPAGVLVKRIFFLMFLIAVLGRMRPAGHGLYSLGLDLNYSVDGASFLPGEPSIEFIQKIKKNCFIILLKNVWNVGKNQFSASNFIVCVSVCVAKFRYPR